MLEWLFHAAIGDWDRNVALALGLSDGWKRGLEELNASQKGLEKTTGGSQQVLREVLGRARRQ